MRHVLSTVLILAALALVGCGDEPAPDPKTSGPDAPPAADAGATPDAAPEEAAPTPAPSADTPAAIGEAVAKVYLDTLKSVTASLEGRPEPAEASAELTRIKAAAVEQLVALGRKRAALDDAGTSVADGKIRAGLMHVPSDVFKAFSEAHKHYMGKDRELGNLLASFNVITQYANFELLKKQLPKEYERLGLGE